jgi:hypothetical protein
MTVAEARASVAAAYASQPAEYRAFFGVTTHETKRATLFVWRNSFTGAWGSLGRAQRGELVEVTLALLDELKTLKTPERKPNPRPSSSRSARAPPGPLRARFVAHGSQR